MMRPRGPFDTKEMEEACRERVEADRSENWWVRHMRLACSWVDHLRSEVAYLRRDRETMLETIRWYSDQNKLSIYDRHHPESLTPWKRARETLKLIGEREASYTSTTYGVPTYGDLSEFTEEEMLRTPWSELPDVILFDLPEQDRATRLALAKRSLLLRRGISVPNMFWFTRAEWDRILKHAVKESGDGG